MFFKGKVPRAELIFVSPYLIFLHQFAGHIENFKFRDNFHYNIASDSPRISNFMHLSICLSAQSTN